MLGSKIFPPNRSFLSLALFVLAAFLSPRTAAQSQPPTPNVDPAIAELASKIAEPLQETNAKVIVADLRGPESQPHPVGKWLADQLSASLKKDFPDLEVIVRPPEENVPPEAAIAPDRKVELAKQWQWARKLGASVVITGTFGKTPQGIDVSLEAANLDYPNIVLGRTSGQVPISAEISALSPDPIPIAENRPVRAGVGGVSLPSCVHCPTPRYSDEARAAELQGTVVLEATITVDGRVINISVTRTPDRELAVMAIKAVKDWKFKPALNAEGKPVPSIVPIEVTFRLGN